MSNTRSIVAAAALACAVSLALPTGSSASWWTPKIREKKTEANPASDQAQADPAKAEEAKPQTAADTTPAPSPAPAPGATAALPAAGVAAATSAPVAASAAPAVLPGASLRKLSGFLRAGPIGREPNAHAYLDLIDAGKATPAQVNDFAAYLAKRGMVKVALEFQEYATKVGPNEPTLWLNYGTMQRTAGNLGGAASAFKKALDLNPNHAMAHYNLGAVYDADKKYDEAIEEYRRALTLDPDLADPRKNPQVVNNENLLAVKLTIYENQVGSLGLPLLQMQKPIAETKAAPPEKK
jgi:tetratricopeptide (TPR) repeat protein